jgi:hypothetical protein
MRVMQTNIDIGLEGNIKVVNLSTIDQTLASSLVEGENLTVNEPLRSREPSSMKPGAKDTM